MLRRNLTTAQVIEYVFTFIYAVVTAMFYSVGDGLYWLFLVLGLITLCLGLYTQSIKTSVTLDSFGAKDKIALIVVTALSVIAFPACLFNLFALLDNQNDKYVLTVNPEYSQAEKPDRPWYKKAAFIVGVVALSLIIVCSLVGQAFETSGWQVSVKDYSLTKEQTDIYNKGQDLNGTSYTIDDPTVSVSYTVYKPNYASATNQLPAVFVVPGFTRTKATMSQYAIELSRRGAVVFVIDPGSQGNTTYGGYEYDDATESYVLDENGNKTQNSYSVARSGMGYLLQYVFNDVDDFDYIDRDRIGLVGHSAGGGDSAKLAADFAGENYEDSIVKALYISGYIKTSAANVFYKLHCNAALSYAKYDEGSFRYQDENQAYEVIAKRFINEVDSKTIPSNGTFDKFIEDQGYGDFSEGTYRIIHHEDINHCFEMYDGQSIANTTAFFTAALSMDTEIADAEQVWFGQEISNGLALVAAFALVIALAFMIVEYVPFMKSLAAAGNIRLANERAIRERYTSDAYERSLSDKPMERRSFAKRLIFWLPTILTAIIACLDYIPLARWSMDLFPDAAGNVYTFVFPARMMNAVFLWALVNGAVGLIVWALTTVCENLYYIIRSAKTGEPNRADWSKFQGLAVKPLDLLKSIGLAIVLFLVFYGLDGLMYAITHQDWRFMLISASPLNFRFFVTWLIYLAGFYVFYLSNSVRVNLGVAREGYKEWQVMLIGGLANSLGLVFILIINYYVYFKTGTVFYGYYSPTDYSEMWLYVNMVFGLIPMMFILPVFNRLMYKKTGNVYGGSLLWCMIFIMMSLSASISFIPM
ncbi:MAG: hypothetical protein IJ811_03815 [Clostridia bacterium]|nr:hypothetical protein [Clostridia bacterium]